MMLQSADSSFSGAEARLWILSLRLNLWKTLGSLVTIPAQGHNSNALSCLISLLFLLSKAAEWIQSVSQGFPTWLAPWSLAVPCRIAQHSTCLGVKSRGASQHLTFALQQSSAVPEAPAESTECPVAGLGSCRAWRLSPPHILCRQHMVFSRCTQKSRRTSFFPSTSSPWPVRNCSWILLDSAQRCRACLASAKQAELILLILWFWALSPCLLHHLFLLVSHLWEGGLLPFSSIVWGSATLRNGFFRNRREHSVFLEKTVRFCTE